MLCNIDINKWANSAIANRGNKGCKSVLPTNIQEIQ